MVLNCSEYLFRNCAYETQGRRRLKAVYSEYSKLLLIVLFTALATIVYKKMEFVNLCTMSGIGIQ